jgi:O-antigen ligase
VFWRPEVGVFFLVPLLPLQTVRYKVIDLPLGNKFIDIILLGVILGVVFRPDFKFKTPLNRLLLVFGAYLYVSLWSGAYFLGTELPWSIADPRFSVWKNYMVMPILFVLVVAVIKNITQIKWLVILMCVSALLIAKSFDSNVGGHDLSHFSYDIRAGAVFGYAGVNGLAAFEAWFGVFLLGLFGYAKKAYLKLGIIGLVSLSIYCLMYSFSRGAYAGFLAGVLFLAATKQKSLLLLVIPFFFLWQIIVPTAVRERVSMTYDESNQQLDTSAGDRVDIWKDAVILIPQYPIMGTGFATYAYMHRVSIYADTHNYYLKVLLETGLIGLLLFLSVLLRASYLAWRLYQTADDLFMKSLGFAVVSAMIPVIVVNLFGDRWTYIEEAGFVWVLWGCVVRGLMMLDDKPTEPAQVAVSMDPQMS